MNAKEHKERHKRLHASLDELVADFIDHTEGLPSKTTLLALMNWSYEQTLKPTQGRGDKL